MVDIVLMAVDSWPPPNEPEEIKRPAYFPMSVPLNHREPVASQNDCKNNNQ